jgi:hypothetical protein
MKFRSGLKQLCRAVDRKMTDTLEEVVRNILKPSGLGNWMKSLQFQHWFVDCKQSDKKITFLPKVLCRIW